MQCWAAAVALYIIWPSPSFAAGIALTTALERSSAGYLAKAPFSLSLTQAMAIRLRTSASSKSRVYLDSWHGGDDVQHGRKQLGHGLLQSVRLSCARMAEWAMYERLQPEAHIVLRSGQRGSSSL